MNKQIAIFATACLVVSVVIAGNILPRVFAQQLENAVRSNPSMTNATTTEKITSFVVLCNKPHISQGVKWEDEGCKTLSGGTYAFMALCPTSAIQSEDYEPKCDLKPIR
jgi:hypothetical protein